jgi:integrase
MDEYVTAERRGRDSLRRFLLDLDAKEANDAEARTIGALVELYFELDAHPSNQGGLAPRSFQQYRWAANRHILAKGARDSAGKLRPPLPHALSVVDIPALRFNESSEPREWREQMLRAGVPPSIRRRAWVVMSAALSWAARSQLVPEIQSNGCLLAGERSSSRRRSARRGGTGYAPATRRRPLARWALSPRAVEAIRAQMLLRVEHRDPLLAHRDAIIVGLQYGLGARSQEVWALRWTALIGSFAWITEVLTSGRVEEWGKTESSTNRRTLLPGILIEDLAQWRAHLTARGHRIANADFVIPGNLGGARYGVLELKTGACHFGEQHAKTWRQRCFTPAVQEAAERPGLADILGATPYALRRGGISLRLRAEDPQTVARECGTSVQMLNSHYAFAIEDLRHQEPRPADVEWREARAALLNHDGDVDLECGVEGRHVESTTASDVRTTRQKLRAIFPRRRQQLPRHQVSD